MGAKKGEYKILKDDDSSDFMKSFLDSFKDKLGQTAEEIKAENRNTNRESRQRLREAEIQLQQDEKLSSQIDEKTKELEVLGRKIEKVQSQIDGIHDDYGSNLDMEAELRRLNQMKKNYEKDFENQKKRIGLAYKTSKERR